MQSFLAKCAAVGIVAGGFTLTGDVGRLAERGQRLLDAQTVPSETPPAEPPAAVAAAAPAVVSDPAPNAFASGRDPEHAVVAATTGLLDIMTDAELEGVMAHEMGHVKNYDIRVSTIVFGLVVAFGFIADLMFRMTYYGSRNSRGGNGGLAMLSLVFGLVAMVIAPLVSALVQAGISRQREFLADATGAMTTRNPEGLASALHKLGEYSAPLQRQSASMAHMWIADPNKQNIVERMFSTHPPIAERVR
jgi:heat shock protein HtpX